MTKNAAAIAAAAEHARRDVIPETGCPVGKIEVGLLINIETRSMHMADRRGGIPDPDYQSVNGSKAWELWTIAVWADETGRLYNERGEPTLLLPAFERTFGRPPRDVRRGHRDVEGDDKLTIVRSAPVPDPIAELADVVEAIAARKAKPDPTRVKKSPAQRKAAKRVEVRQSAARSTSVTKAAAPSANGGGRVFVTPRPKASARS